ncbi:hypothetical protein ABII15_18270 [Streptomyces sp. HUAS MG91]|uniref:Uncharacterized protein n=1 Tax=Streptomyces tabacisoli TaxID=3156398 RepID=A0AAU8IU36_9ACTN
MSETPPEATPPPDSTEPSQEEGNVALPVPVDSVAATAGDGGSSADTLPPPLPG